MFLNYKNSHLESYRVLWLSIPRFYSILVRELAEYVIRLRVSVTRMSEKHRCYTYIAHIQVTLLFKTTWRIDMTFRLRH